MTVIKDYADMVVSFGGAISMIAALYLLLRRRVIQLVTTPTSRRKTVSLAALTFLRGPRYTITRTAVPKWSARTSTHVLIMLILLLSVANLVVFEDRIWVERPAAHPAVRTFDSRVTETTASHVVLSGDVGTAFGDGKFKILLLASCKTTGQATSMDLIYVAGHGSAPSTSYAGGMTQVDMKQIDTWSSAGLRQEKRGPIGSGIDLFAGNSDGWTLIGTVAVSRDGTFMATVPRREHNLDIIAVLVPSNTDSSGWVHSVYDLEPVARSEVVRVAALVPDRATGNNLTRP